MYPDGYCTDYAYDLCDRLVTVTGRDSGVTTYQYDANGNVTRCDRSNSTYTTYTYNARNNLISLENRRANSSNDLLSSYVYEYDQNGYITKETEQVDSYTYVRTYTYDAVGQLTGYIETTNGQQTAKYEYSYDAAGNRTGMVYFDASNTRYWTDYVYDDNNELVTETYNYRKNKNKIISTVTTYTYDTDGDLVTKNVDGSEIWQYLWTAESRLEAVTKGGTLLMAATYDGDNNRIFQISDAASSSKVHEDNQLKKEWKKENGNSYPWENGNGNGGNGTGHSNTGNGSTNNGGQHNHTGNNSDGLKHANCKQCLDEQEAFVQSLADDAVSIDGVDYLPVGKPNSYKDYELIYYINDVTIANEEVLVEYGANGTATGTYEYGLQRLSVEYVNEAKEYYLYNGTGNVTQTTAQNGSMFLRYTYDPFGNVETINAPMVVDIDDLNRYTYNGEDYDFNTGLQYLRARYYNTSVGGFISQDTYLGQIINPISRNRYTYAHNSPVVFDDPSGHLVLELIILGIIIVSSVAVLSGCENNNNNSTEITAPSTSSTTYIEEYVESSIDNGNNKNCYYIELANVYGQDTYTNKEDLMGRASSEEIFARMIYAEQTHAEYQQPIAWVVANRILSQSKDQFANAKPTNLFNVVTAPMQFTALEKEGGNNLAFIAHDSNDEGWVNAVTLAHDLNTVIKAEYTEGVKLTKDKEQDIRNALTNAIGEDPVEDYKWYLSENQFQKSYSTENGGQINGHKIDEKVYNYGGNVFFNYEYE